MSSGSQMRMAGYDDDGVQRDVNGRKHPTRLNLVTLNKAVPGLLGQIEQQSKQVPESHIASSARQSDGRRAISVTCPCGEFPVVPVAGSKACGCGRVYANLGSRVRVLHSPTA